MTPGQHLPPDHSKGDESTVAGYAAVHARPAALEGRDGLSYSLEILADTTGEPARPFGAYLLFVQWRLVGEQGPSGHLESEFLAFGETAARVRHAIGAMPLAQAQGLLDALIAVRDGASAGRRRWDVLGQPGGA